MAPIGFPRVVVILLALSTFGPYLWGGMRLEQAVTYGLTLALLPIIVTRFNPNGGKRFFLPWVFYVVIASLGVFFPLQGESPFPPGNLLSGLDNIFSPLAIMLLIWSVVPAESALQLLLLLGKILSVGMAANGLLAILSTRVDTSSLLKLFWASSDSLGSVAKNSLTMGRYTGIFNQPLEAGTLYGVAGLVGILAWQKRPALLATLLTLITIGGLISVSKVFVLAGLPAILIYWFVTSLGKRKLSLIVSICIIAASVLLSGILNDWTGRNYLLRLFSGTDQSFLAFYSAGRFSDQSLVSQVIDAVLRLNPVSGVGIAGWAVAYDSMVVEVLVVAGVLGLIVQSIILISILLLPKSFSGTLRWFSALFVGVLIAANLGFFPLTANRVSTVVWLLISLLVLVIRSHSASLKESLPKEVQAKGPRITTDVATSP